MKYYITTVFNKEIGIVLCSDFMSRMDATQMKMNRRTYASMLKMDENLLVLACLINKELKFFYGHENLIHKLEQDKNSKIEWKNLN